MDTLPGFIVTFDNDIVVHKDVSYFESTRRELIELTVEYRKLNHLELLIGGYDDDNRSLYEVPEVRRWIKLVHATYPDLLFWLTPGSLWIVTLSLNPSFHSRLPDGRLQIAFEPQALLPQFSESYVHAEEVLTKAGMKKKTLDVVKTRAQQNFSEMFERKLLGKDYVVVYPKETG